MTSVGSLLEEGSTLLATAGCDSPRLDAELLLGHVLGVDRTGVLAHPDAPVGDGPAAAYRDLVERRTAGEPVAYLRGIREFHGLAFAVDRRVLIPRPETELLVDLALERLRARLTGTPRPRGAPPLLVRDVGTGSGAIAVALAVALRRHGLADEVVIEASDVSPGALAVASENAVAHGVADRVTLTEVDLLTGYDGPRIDLIVANLPYVATSTVPTLGLDLASEPVLALDGGPDGLDLVWRLVADLPTVLTDGGRALLEIGADQAAAVRDGAAAILPEGWTVVIHDDLAGLPRATEVIPASHEGPPVGGDRRAIA